MSRFFVSVAECELILICYLQQSLCGLGWVGLVLCIFMPVLTSYRPVFQFSFGDFLACYPPFQLVMCC